MTEKNIDAIGWGSFLIWVGIAIIADFGFPIGLLGVGIITLIAQIMRKSFNHKVEVFWVIAGFLFVIGGISGIMKIDIPLIPILIIIAGIVILTSVIKRKKG
jgi:hypothetical protein